MKIISKDLNDKIVECKVQCDDYCDTLEKVNAVENKISPVKIQKDRA